MRATAVVKQNMPGCILAAFCRTLQCPYRVLALCRLNLQRPAAACSAGSQPLEMLIPCLFNRQLAVIVLLSTIQPLCLLSSVSMSRSCCKLGTVA